MGLERNMDGGPVIKGFVERLQDQLKGAFSGRDYGSARGSLEVEVSVKDEKLKAAVAAKTSTPAPAPADKKK